TVPARTALGTVILTVPARTARGTVIMTVPARTARGTVKMTVPARTARGTVILTVPAWTARATVILTVPRAAAHARRAAVGTPQETGMDNNRNAPAQADAEVVIDAPIELVWNLQADVQAWPSWNPDVQEVTLEGPLAPGTTFRWKTGG